MAATLSVRLSRRAVRLCAPALALACAVASAHAQGIAPLLLDWNFGDGGLGLIPSAVNGANVVGTYGFVRMRAGLGYVALSTQTVNGVRRPVATRFTDDGDVYAPWGAQGSQIYALPAPDDAVMTVNVEGGVDFIYVAYVFRDTDASSRLLVARLDSGNGALAGLAISALPSGFPTQGPGWATAIAPACAGACLASEKPGVVVAVQGRGTDSSTTELVQAGAGANGMGTLVLTLTEHRFGSLVDVPGLSINQLLPRPDATFEGVGSAQGEALYLRYDAHSDQLVQFKTLALPCGAGASAASAADGLVRDASLGADGALLLGRAECDGAVNAVLARLPGFDAAPPTPSWSVSIGAVVDGYGCSPLTERCSAAFAALSSPGHAYAAVAAGYLARVDFADGAARVTGRDSLLTDDATFFVQPSFALGAYADSPWLTGVGIVSAGGNFMAGLSRVAVDRVFADGMD